MNREQHEMILEITHSSGAEEWYCPTCGRRMTLTWQPWKKIILEVGNIYAAHSGSKGGLRAGPLQITKDNDDVPSLATEQFGEDPHLAPWLRWLDEIDLDDLWDKEG